MVGSSATKVSRLSSRLLHVKALVKLQLVKLKAGIAALLVQVTLGTFSVKQFCFVYVELGKIWKGDLGTRVVC